MKTSINRLVVVGLGLIGASVAAAIKQRQLISGDVICNEIIGVARRQETADTALQNGFVDRAFLSIADIANEITDQDIILIAVPTLSVPKIIQEIKEHVASTATITDAASVKGSVIKAVEQSYGEVPPFFVAGHPIAGSEQSGVEAANPNLYVNHRVILTPVENTSETHLERVKGLWQTIEAEVLTMHVDDHDEVLAATSHLPHAIAYSLVDTLASDVNNENIFRYAAGGFRDFTRIASSDPLMWHDIMQANRDAILQAIDLFQTNLGQLRNAVEQGDSDALLSTFSRAKTARDHFTQLLTSKVS